MWVGLAMAAAMPDCSEIEFSNEFLYETWSILVGLEGDYGSVHPAWLSEKKVLSAIAPKQSGD